ncbi:MAG: hypothetical protein ABEJ42_06845 [Halobacteriaceae archaeon]
MGDLDPVSWEEIAAVLGPPAPAVTAAVERHRDDLRDVPPYEAVKTVHDALAADPDGADVPDQGEVLLVTYLLERDGVVDLDAAPETGVPSVLARRPSDERLRELSWDRERTMWWIAVRLGVHWSLVRYWLWEADVPLKERNFGPESMAKLRAHRDGDAGGGAQ